MKNRLQALLFLAPIFIGSHVGAATNTWTGSTNSTWSTVVTDTNWASPTTWTNGDDAIFGATGIGPITVSGTVTAHNLTFNNSGYTIQGGGFSLVTAGATITTDPTVSATVSSVVGGTVGLTKTGTGTLTLSGTNSYTGTTAVNGGTLVLSPTTTTNTTYNFSSDNYTLSNAATLKFDFSGMGTGSGFVTVNVGAVNTTGGTVELFSDATKHSNSTNAVLLGWSAPGAVFSGSGIINKEGAGFIDLNTIGALNSFTGTLNVNGGALQLQGTSTSTVGNFAISIGAAGILDLRTDAMKVGALNGAVGAQIGSSHGGNSAISIGNNNGDGIFNGNIGVNTTGIAIKTFSLTKAGTGTQTLSGTNLYTGKTTISAGTLQFAKTASLYNNTAASWTGANITVANGATLALNVGGTGEFSAANVDTLLTNISVASNNTTGLQAGAKLAFDTSTAAGGTFTQGNAIANSTGTSGGAIGLTKLGTGTLVLDKTNTYTGTTTVSAGTLSITGNSSAVTGAVTVSGGSLYVSGQLGGNVTVANGASIGGNGTIGTLALNGTSNLDLTNLSAAVDLTTSGISFASVGFGVDNLLLNGAAIDWSTVADGTYTLLNGTLNSANLDNFGAANAYDIDGGSGSRTAYFQSGSLQLVVVPEPAAALLGSLGLLALLRRRRN